VAVGVLLLGLPLFGQAGTENSLQNDVSQGQIHLGYPQDWSSRHLVITGTDTDDLLAAGAHDPRYVFNAVHRMVAQRKAQQAAENTSISRWLPWQPWPPLRASHGMKIDWAVSLENGYVAQKQFPAKFQFEITTESCTADYIIFALTVTSGTTANLVGINNLYTEMTPTACNGGQPLAAFAFNTLKHGGQIVTSPTLSWDGKKVAFVESTASGTYFHVLVLPNPIPTTSGAAYGTVRVPKTPGNCPSGDPATADCMTDLAISTTATDSNSSPWIDYKADTAYVGTDAGILYKITPVFKGGAPALVSNSDWPVTVSQTSSSAPITNQSCNTVLTDPIVDNVTGKIFIGDGGGFLRAVNLTSPGKTTSATQTIGWAWSGAITNCAGIPSGGGSGQAGTGVVDAPIVVVDAANASNQVFAFTGCSYVLGIGGAVSQLPTTFTTGVPTTANTVDLGSATGQGDCTSANLHSGTVDNLFWLYGTGTGPLGQGHIITCGFVNNGGKPAKPQMYMFPFANNVVTSTGNYTFVIDTTAGDECSPLTEFYNGTKDMMFFGLGGPATTPTDGFIEASTLGATSLTTPSCAAPPTSTCVKAPSALQGTSGIVIDNNLSNGGTNIYFTTQAPGGVNNQNCHVAGGVATPYCAVKLTQSALN
jgi:hypothetical protein